MRDGSPPVFLLGHAFGQLFDTYFSKRGYSSMCIFSFKKISMARSSKERLFEVIAGPGKDYREEELQSRKTRSSEMGWVCSLASVRAFNLEGDSGWASNR